MQSARVVSQKPAGAAGLIVSRRFGPLFWTQFLSAFNDNALKNALVLMIAYRPEIAGGWSPGIVIPLAGGLFILPYFLCSATAGMLADTTDKARLARLIKFIEIFVMLSAALAVLLGHAGWILALLFAMGVEAAFFGPLKYAILPDLLAPDELLLGNALVEAGTFLAILLGTIAGVLIAGEHGGASVAVLIVVVAVSAWGASRRIRPVPPPATGRADWNLVAATARLIRDAAREKVTYRAMLGISWFWLAGATYLSQFPSFVRFVLGAEEGVVTLLLAIFSIGIATGSLLCNKVLGGKVSPRTVPWGALGMGVLSIDVFFASPAPAGGAALVSVAGLLAEPMGWRIVLDLFGIALFGGVFVVPLYALLQVASDETVRARTIAANNVVNAAAMVLAAVATVALVAAGVSVPGLFLVTGIATLAVAGVFWRIAPGLTA
ncbi:MAG TPA: MFS transporter [Stellaceae bacterium]|jgi:MFS family permease|nr:MFS transporter [Stellaceae bacterium]